MTPEDAERRSAADRKVMWDLYHALELPELEILADQAPEIPVHPVQEAPDDGGEYIVMLDDGFGTLDLEDYDQYVAMMEAMDDWNDDEEVPVVDRMVECGFVASVWKVAQMVDATNSIMLWDNKAAKQYLLDLMVQIVGQLQQCAQQVIHPNEGEDEDGDETDSED